MKVKIDRIEGNYALIEAESGYLIQIPLSLLPEETKEGDSLEACILEERTREKKAKLQRLHQELW